MPERKLGLQENSLQPLSPLARRHGISAADAIAEPLKKSEPTIKPRMNLPKPEISVFIPKD